MSVSYLRTDGAEKFKFPGADLNWIVFNPHLHHFLLINEPSLAELSIALEEYGNKRLEDRWNELMQPGIRQKNVINGLTNGFSRMWGQSMLKITEGETVEEFKKKIKTMTLQEQREVVSVLKPNGISEMIATYVDNHALDMTGYRYLCHELSSSKTGFEFFSRLLNALFEGIATSNYELGSPKLGFHQPRILEFLGLALTKGWLLFPYIVSNNGNKDITALTHADNVIRYLNPIFGPKEAHDFRDYLTPLLNSNSTINFSLKAIERLIISSNYRDLSQTNVDLFLRCLELTDTGGDNAYRQVGFARKGFNCLILLHNSRFPDVPPLSGIYKAKKIVSLDEVVSFEEQKTANPYLSEWADAFTAWLKTNRDVPQALVTQKTTCMDMLNFLAETSSAPRSPKDCRRSLINDYTSDGTCFRNYLSKTYSGAGSKNQKLQQMGQFFTSHCDALCLDYIGPSQLRPYFVNPVDMRFDRFKEPHRAGTKRKAIGARIMEEMRQVLVEDDYKWPKQWDDAWGYLVNQETRELEHVWCPSAAISLFVNLSIPLRNTQARMFDSGEGDRDIFDFEKRAMVPNPNQLAVDGKLDPNRREGFIQVMPSGLEGEPELVGMWVNTDKVSDEGYPIPWVSEELLQHLAYQASWIRRYAPNPEMHCVEDALGHRNSAQESVERLDHFYCLFRDPTAKNVHSPSLPVAKQKVHKLWGRLCLEVQRRINARGDGGQAKVRLVVEGSENDLYPKAVHDIHSLRVSGITDLLDRGVPLNIVSTYIVGHATYVMTLWYDKPAPGLIRKVLLAAQKSVGDPLGPLPSLSEGEVQAMSPFLVSHPDYVGTYTGFDALNDNKGLVKVRHDGICPGTRCEEGGLNESGRPVPVPAGDRGPSCPQCRFNLTGPAFLLGQTIEGNQLILKIRQKVHSIASTREAAMNAEDLADFSKAKLLQDKNDREEVDLNNMLTEWWHRMQFYKASIAMLEAFNDSRESSNASPSKNPLALVKHQHTAEIQYGYGATSELELKHFLSTCAELLPSFSDEHLNAHQDIELAVGKFLALNDDSLATVFFRLSEPQRLKAANLTVELLFSAMDNPTKVVEMLEGKHSLQAIPYLQNGLSTLMSESMPKPKVSRIPINVKDSVE